MPIRIQRAIRERQLPGPGQPPLTTPQDFGAGIADAMSELGRRIAQQEDENRRIRTRQAMNAAHFEASRIVEESKLRTGENAAGLTIEAQKQLAKIGEKYANGMDRRSRQQFRQMYDSQSAQYLTSLYAHESEQQRVAIGAQREASFDLALSDATRDPYDMANVAMSYERMEAIRLEQAEAEGWPEAATQAQLMKDRTTLWRSVIERQLSLGDDRSAKSTLDYAMDEIDGRDVVDLTAKIESAGKVRGLQKLRDDLVHEAYGSFLTDNKREPSPEEHLEMARNMASDRLDGEEESDVIRMMLDQFKQQKSINDAIVSQQVAAGKAMLQTITDPAEQDRFIATIDRPEAQQQLRAIARVDRQNFADDEDRNNRMAFESFVDSVDAGSWRDEIRRVYGDSPTLEQVRSLFYVKSQDAKWTEDQHERAWQYAQTGSAGKVKVSLFNSTARNYGLIPGTEEWHQAWKAFVKQANTLPGDQLPESQYPDIMFKITESGYGVTADDYRSAQGFKVAGAMDGEAFLPGRSYDAVVQALEAQGIEATDISIADEASRLQRQVEIMQRTYGRVVSVEDLVRQQAQLNAAAAREGLTIPGTPPPLRATTPEQRQRQMMDRIPSALDRAETPLF